MLTQWIIEKKRDGQSLTREEIILFLTGYLRDEVPDYQMSALAMAIYFQDMSDAETAAFTESMLIDSIKIHHDNLPAPKIDKHSTGGVGDKVSLILAPLAAACGLVVPMIAGRGLGATGGTIDKLESIPGFRTDLSEDEFQSVLIKAGCSIIGQSKKIAPIDRRLYALRDVTGTVPSMPLIVASILSKKLAAGLDGLVLDVKWGRGAFMQEIDRARDLARRLTATARNLGLPCTALLTDMNQPLGRAAGNAPEVVEAIDVLRGHGPADTLEVSLALTERMLLMGRLVETPDSARRLMSKNLDSGAALERLLRMVELQGGDPRAIEHPERLPQPEHHALVRAPRSGQLTSVDAGLIGRACVALGAGRKHLSDAIDFSAGITEIAKMGRAVREGEKLALLQGSDNSRLQMALPLAAAAFTIGEAPVTSAPLISEEIKQVHNLQQSPSYPGLPRRRA